jgi:ketosteroid isomerase-like protein
MEVMGMGDMVCEIGKAVVTVEPEGMDAVQDIGKYVVIWKKSAEGVWQLYIDIWNSNLPVQ